MLIILFNIQIFMIGFSLCPKTCNENIFDIEMLPQENGLLWILVKIKLSAVANNLIVYKL